MKGRRETPFKAHRPVILAPLAAPGQHYLSYLRGCENLWPSHRVPRVLVLEDLFASTLSRGVTHCQRDSTEEVVLGSCPRGASVPQSSERDTWEVQSAGSET